MISHAPRRRPSSWLTWWQVDAAMSEKIKDEESGGGEQELEREQRARPLQVQVEGKPNMPVSMPSFQIERIPTAGVADDDERWEVKFEPGESVNPKVSPSLFRRYVRERERLMAEHRTGESNTDGGSLLRRGCSRSTRHSRLRSHRVLPSHYSVISPWTPYRPGSCAYHWYVARPPASAVRL